LVERVELSGNYFITQSSGFDGAVVSVFYTYYVIQGFPVQAPPTAKSKTDELSHTDES